MLTKIFMGAAAKQSDTAKNHINIDDRIATFFMECLQLKPKGDLILHPSGSGTTGREEALCNSVASKSRN
jgi:hypothetical protein